MAQTSTSAASSVGRQYRQPGGLRRDLLPVMAILGAVYGWVIAILAIIVASLALFLG